MTEFINRGGVDIKWNGPQWFDIGMKSGSIWFGRFELSAKSKVWQVVCIQIQMTYISCTVMYFLYNKDQPWCFPFRKHFQSIQLKCKWYVQLKWKFSRTNGRPSEVPHFFSLNWLEQKLLSRLRKISISAAHKSACAYTNFMRHHNLLVRLQVFCPHGNSISF